MALLVLIVDDEKVFRNYIGPEEFNKISRLENAKEIWDTLICMKVPTP